MQQQDIERIRGMFYPRRVAVIGATDSPDRVGYNLLESLIYGGFPGEIYPVHPKLESILGLRVYRSLSDIPYPVDLALVSLNQHATVEAVEQCARLGVKGAVCVAGGFREIGEAGLALEKRLVDIAARYGIKVVGPNTLGIINTDASLDASFYPLHLPKGSVSFITQSGGIGLYILQKATDEGLGINKWIGVGNRTVLEIADYLEYLLTDPGTEVIGIFLEGVDDTRRLVQVAGRAVRQKPVVVYKVGQSDAVNYAAMTHTGSIAGSHRLFQDIFQQHGILLVESVPELIAACKALSLCTLPAGNRAGLYTYTAGPSIVALDRLAEKGVGIPAFTPESIQKIKGILGKNPPVILKNPLDAAGLGFAAETYGRLVEAVLEDTNVDLLATFSCVQKNWRNPTRELIAARQKYDKPILACYISTVQEVAEDRKGLQEAGIPLYLSPDEAAWGAAALVHFSKLKTGVTPDVAAPDETIYDSDKIRNIIAAVRTGGRNLLLEDEAKELLSACGIPVTPCLVARNVEEAVVCAQQLGYPVVIKIRSPKILHKSERGGVRLNIVNEQSLRRAYAEMVAGTLPLDPGAAVTVQPMAAEGIELIIGITTDEQFGPVVACGLGGIFTEIIKDIAFRMLPLDQAEAIQMLRQIRGSRLLEGYRGKPPGNVQALAGIINRLSDLVLSTDEIVEMDLNPVVAYPGSALVLDARIVLRPDPDSL